MKLVGGKSNAWILSALLLVLPCVALNPSPLLAKAAQIIHWFAPLYKAMSAAKIASLPLTKPGLQGCNFNASVTKERDILFPPVPL